MKVWLRVLCLTLLPLALWAAEPQTQASSYLLGRGSLTLGEGELIVEAQGAPGCFRYTSHAAPRGVAALFIGEIREVSEFCVVNGGLQPKHYEYQRSDRAKDNYVLDFDWVHRVVRRETGEQRPLEAGMLDRLTMQIAIQLWAIDMAGNHQPPELSLQIVDDDRIKDYRFAVLGRERIKVPAGSYDTMRIERVDDPKKSTRFWLAPELGYRAVRVEQIKKGEEEFHLELKAP